MNLHLNRELFVEMIDTISQRSKIAADIIEKDCYVCLVLMKIAKQQNTSKVYFKGGTAIYKILDEMNRFSEDIDLTVKIVREQSNTKNKNRLKEVALGYNLEGLELVKEETVVNKWGVTGIYKYESLYENTENQLYRSGRIKIEATSFTVSEPTKQYKVMPLIYKISTDKEKEILKSKFEVNEFEIQIITLERMFVDKLFATEFYYIRKMYSDTVKHLYDIAILYENYKIKQFLKNSQELKRLVEYKRQEETLRKGGIEVSLKIRDFTYFKQDFDDKLLKEFDNMQNKYVLNEKHKISIEQVKNTLNEIKSNKNIEQL